MTNVAVFGVDPQNDFGHPKGALYCKNGFQVVGGGMILVEHAYNKGLPIMFSADDHPQDSDHFRPKGFWPPHCIHCTWGARFLAGVKIPYGSAVFFKGTRKHEDGYDPFEGKDGQGRSPEQVLRSFNTTTVIVWGIATNYCVRTFVLTARKKGYEVYVVLDACAPVPTPAIPPEGFVTEECAIEDMKAAGAVMTTVEEIVRGKVLGSRE